MRCSNCYNELPADATSCPSCMFIPPEHYQNAGQDVFSNLATVTAARPGIESRPQVESAPKVEQEGADKHAAAQTPNGSSRPLPTSPLSTRPSTAKRGNTKPLSKSSETGRVAGASALRRRVEEANESSRAQSLAKMIIPIIVIGGVCAYLYMFTDVFQGRVSPKHAMATMNDFRGLQSSRPGLTIDQLASDILDQSQKSGNLATYKGWLVRPIPGARSKALVIFAFSEKDGQEHSAEWLGDLSSGVFMPQTDLAKEIYPGPNSGQQGSK
jgi:hypothetical protein